PGVDRTLARHRLRLRRRGAGLPSGLRAGRARLEHHSMSDVFFTRAGKLAARKVAGEVVILRADDSSLYVLNPVATAVWEAADGRTPLDAVVRDVICREY